MRGDTSATHATYIIATQKTYYRHTQNIYYRYTKNILSPHKKDTKTFTNDYIESEKFKQNNQYIN